MNRKASPKVETFPAKEPVDQLLREFWGLAQTMGGTPAKALVEVAEAAARQDEAA